MRDYEKEMHNLRYDVINKMNKIVHPCYAEAFAAMLHYTWQEGLPEAQMIVDKLDLYPIDFAALALDLNEFTELQTIEKEMWQYA